MDFLGSYFDSLVFDIMDSGGKKQGNRDLSRIDIIGINMYASLPVSTNHPDALLTRLHRFEVRDDTPLVFLP